MPAHDWTKVSPGIFHDFHNAWVVELKKALNAGLLPPGYYALSEQVAGQTAPDVIALELTSSPQAEPHREPGLGPRGKGGAVAATLPPPKASIIARTEGLSYSALRKTVVIRHVEGHEVVALIEILSRSNKASRGELDIFVTKALSALKQGIHLLVIDLYPSGRLDPDGVHGVIWTHLGQAVTKLPVGRLLLAASYEAAPEVTAYVEPFRVGDPVPAMPLFLAIGEYVQVPLERTYVLAFETVPSYWRERVQA